MTVADTVEAQVRTDVQSITSTSRQSQLTIWLEGCGAGILLMLQEIWWNIPPYHTDLYHRFLPMNTVFGGLAIDLILACLLCTGVIWLINRFDPTSKTPLWAVIAILLLIQTSKSIVRIGLWYGISKRFGALVTLIMLAFIVGAFLVWLLKRSWYGRKAVPAFRGFLAALGICILWMLPQLIYMAIRPEPHDIQKFVRAVPPARVPQRRIVWILFDELSQDQVFDHRQPGMPLPQLDQFRSQSVMFSDMQPAGYFTEDVVPSLLWGKVVAEIRSDLRGNLSVETSKRWQRFPAQQTLFADAQREGWSTGTAGWYNPYCRTYGASLDWCAWVARFSIAGNYLPEKPLLWNISAPLIRDELPNSVEHSKDYTDLMRWSHELIDDEKIGFVFLHLPLPHPGGFYDPKTGKLGVAGTYLGNLVLTDLSLGQLMQWISETKLASKTTVIVCSDHSWRVPQWRSRFSQEEEKAADGKFDTRPVLMVHFPGEKTPEVVSKPFPAVNEHDLIESLLHQPMTATGLKDWARGKATHLQ